MSSINSGMGQPPIVSSAAGIGSSAKGSSSEKTAKADGSISKVVEKAHSESNGLKGAESNPDRDADGRQLYQDTEESASSQSAESEGVPSPPPARSQDPHKKRGNRLDLDA